MATWGSPPRSTSTCAKSAPPPSPASCRPFGAPCRTGTSRRPVPAPGSSIRSPSHLRRVDRRRARLPRTGPGRPLRPYDPGFYLYTLCAVDVATTWVDLQAVWGKGQKRVGTAIHHVRQRLPMPLRGLDSDNGSEFINHDLYAWCQREGITFTRSRPYQKNDSAHVEQKNGAIVRPLIGYDRYAPRPPMPSSLVCMTSRACTSTSSNRSSSSFARSAAARACIACTIAPAPRISVSGRRATPRPSAAGARGGVSAPEPAASSPSARDRPRAPLDLGGPARVVLTGTPGKRPGRGIGRYGLAPNSRAYGLPATRAPHPDPGERPRRARSARPAPPAVTPTASRSPLTRPCRYLAAPSNPDF